MNYAQLDQAVTAVRARWPDAAPRAGLICGSGWGEVVKSFTIVDSLPYEAIPGLGKTGVVGHAGRLVRAEAHGVETFIFQGRRHHYEGEGWTPVALPVYLLRQFGAGTVLLTNSAGGARADLRPGDLMVITDHINFLFANPLTGPHHPVWGPRFPDQSQVYTPALREILRRAAGRIGLPLAEGVYLASPGPTYETPAEVRMFRAWGADALGMSTVPEAILASAAGLAVVGVSCITNLAAGTLDQPLSHEEVTEMTRLTMPKMQALVAAFWRELGEA
jgi:purine-nucleoside phosphorylase